MSITFVRKCKNSYKNNIKESRQLKLTAFVKSLERTILN